MAFDNEKCIASRWKMGKESGRMEPQPQHQTPYIQTSGKTPKEMWRRNQRIPQGRGNWRNERQRKKKNNDTWIKVAKNRERWIAMESEYASTAAAASVDSVHSRRCPPQDPIRPARLLNGVKLDDYWVARYRRAHFTSTRITRKDELFVWPWRVPRGRVELKWTFFTRSQSTSKDSKSASYAELRQNACNLKHGIHLDYRKTFLQSPLDVRVITNTLSRNSSMYDTKCRRWGSPRSSAQRNLWQERMKD